MSRRWWVPSLEPAVVNPLRMPLGVPYPQALAMSHHRLDRRRAATLEAIEAVHAAAARRGRAGSPEGAPGAAPAPAKREDAGPGVPGGVARASRVGCWDLL